MFYSISKWVGFVLVPSNFILGITVLGAILLWTRFQRAGRRILACSISLVLLGGLSPLGTALLLPLEERFPPWDASRGAPAGMIVLGGVINPALSLARGEMALGDAAERIVVVAELARRYPAAKVVFAGGSLTATGVPESVLAKRLFESFGISADRIGLETRSRSTAENAAYTFELVAPKPGDRWVLITSAYHMPRAIGSFRKVGFPVEAYPVDWQTFGRRQLFMPPGMLLDGITRLDLAEHEWLGLIAYWMSGRTSELFPRP